MPVTIPILKKDSVELVVQPTIRRTQVHSHVTRRVWMDVEAVDSTCFDRHLAIFRVHLAVLTINLDAHDARLHPEIFGLELVEMQQGALGPPGRLDEFAQVFRDRSIELVLVGLAKEEASAWWWLEKFGSENSAESEMLAKTDQYYMTCSWFFGPKI